MKSRSDSSIGPRRRVLSDRGIRAALVPLGATLALAPGMDGALAAPGSQVVTIAPARDNTLFSTETTSNGAGGAIFSGRTAGGTIQRAVLAFDVHEAVPAGARILDARLTLTLVQTSSGPQTHSLHRVNADWGEGASSGSGGSGAPAAPGDATWVHTFFPDRFWAAPGGDFTPAVSSSTVVDAAGASYAWPSTPRMVQDVQAWADDPGGNFGWLLAGNETDPQTAKKFASREATQVQARPVLTIEFTTCPWDLDGDGDVDARDLRLLLADFPRGECPASCPADFDGDGVVDVEDLLVLVRNFGACP